jgi:Flp pilus assembly protein TadD
MQRQSWKLALVVGLGFVLLGGCANFKWKGSDNSMDAASKKEAAADLDPASLTGPSKGESDVQGGKKASQNPTRKWEGQFALAHLSESRGEDQQAESAYRELLKLEPKDARIHHRLGVMELKKGNFTQAEECFAEAKTLAPPNAELLSDIGYCYYLQQKLPEAEKVLRDALKIDSTYETAVNNLALVLGRQGRYQESKELFLRTNSESETYANLGYVLAQNGETAKAKQMYLRALTLDNKMQVAAKALLQIEEREKTMTRLASAGSAKRPAAARPVEEEILELPRSGATNSTDIGESMQTIYTQGVVDDRS